MENQVIHIYKNIGETPLEVIQRFKVQNSKFKDSKIAYAGRLDPMARGEMILLIDEECKNRDHYQGLDKVYQFEVLFGVETDTYDILGRISGIRDLGLGTTTYNLIPKTLESFIGKQNQPYPPYSSINLNGHPLFWWARNGKLNEIEIPTKVITIYSLELIDSYEIKNEELKMKILERIDLVKGDFRQEEIKKDWEEFFLKNESEKKFKIYKFEAKVSSGTYIRQLVHEMGAQLNVGAIAVDINRTKIVSGK